MYGSLFGVCRLRVLKLSQCPGGRALLRIGRPRMVYHGGRHQSCPRRFAGIRSVFQGLISFPFFSIIVLFSNLPFSLVFWRFSGKIRIPGFRKWKWKVPLEVCGLTSWPTPLPQVVNKPKPPPSARSPPSPARREYAAWVRFLSCSPPPPLTNSSPSSPSSQGFATDLGKAFPWQHWTTWLHPYD